MENLQSLEKEIREVLSSISSLGDIQKIKSKYLGPKGVISELFKTIKDIEPAKRKEFGQALNNLKELIQTELSKKQEEIKNASINAKENVRDIDLDAPWGINAKQKPTFLNIEANKHPITIELERFLGVFRRMGFQVFQGRELDNDYYNFESLAMPKEHPAREMWDTFYTEEKFIPAVHTSNMQVRVMRHIGKPPVRAVVYGKCFRNEEIDATHSHTFYQIEGLYVDKKINIGNMLYTIKSFLEGFFEQKIIWRIQPGHFPFVEPAVEAVIQCVFCNGKGCSSCKYSGWLEILGAGMIHPKVLENGGFDPKQYSGFAWGMGIERVIMNKNDIKDIRLLTNNDIRLLRAR